MRVLHVMAGAAHGGAETYFVDMLEALGRAGLDQAAAIRTHAGRALRLRAAGLEVFELPFGGPFDLMTRPRLARIVKETRPDIVQSWMSRATRFVSRPRGAPPFVHVGWFGGYYKVANYRACDHVVGVTPDIRAHQIAGGINEGRAHYIPTFAHQETAPPVPRASLGTPDGVPLYLALGRLHEKKAFDILIRAAARVPDAHVWIAGEGDRRGDLERLIAQERVGERVRLLGWRDDRAALFAACDVCVMPSRFEPFGTVMIEAWAQERPLIVAAAKGPLGLVEDGRTALVVPIDDVDALAAAMIRIRDDPGLARALVENGHAAFLEGFTEAAVTERYMEFYRSIVQP